MQYKRIQDIIELNNITIKEISRDTIFCFAIVGGNPYGTDGDVYIFTAENKERKVYRGNMYSGKLSESELVKCIPELGPKFTFYDIKSKCPSEWRTVPYCMGYYLFMPKEMSENISEIWKSLGEQNAENRMILGVLAAHVSYFNGIPIRINVHKKRKENILEEILKLYPELWKDPKRFKAVLMDLIPEDKMKRNLLCMCVEEKIPQDIIMCKNLGNFEIQIYKKRLVNSCGCSEKIATEIISMWINAISNKEMWQEKHYMKKTLNELEEADLDVRTFHCLYRADIKTLEDLVQHTDEEIRNIRNLGRKSYEKIIRLLDKYGLELKSDEDL